jgi:hypothetical protein
VLAATAEALDLSPRAIRPGLLAAFKAMHELGLDAETAMKGLSDAVV